MTNAATIARALTDALDTTRFAAGEDFAHLDAKSAAQAAARCGVELAALSLAHALELKGDARAAFLVAAGVRRIPEGAILRGAA